jgi:hypothetical protein
MVLKKVLDLYLIYILLMIINNIKLYVDIFLDFQNWMLLNFKNGNKIEMLWIKILLIKILWIRIINKLIILIIIYHFITNIKFNQLILIIRILFNHLYKN